MAELTDFFSLLPDELLNDIILYSHATVSPDKRWKKQIEVLIAKTIKELQAMTTNVFNCGLSSLKSHYLTLKQQAEEKIRCEVIANYSPLSSSFYQMLNQHIEDTNLSIFWEYLTIDNKPNLNAKEIRLWMKEQQAQKIGLLQQQEITINRRLLTLIPLEIAQLQQLQRLMLKKNQITQLPSGIGQLQQLQVLNLDDNQITQLSSEIGQIHQLQYLYLRNNQITQLPSEIGQLQQLQYLYLDTNQITQFPSEVGQLQLQVLNLDNNRISQLPSEIGQLQQLQLLYLDNNQITQLPSEIGQLQQLRELHLVQNQINQLPIELNYMSTIIKLK